MSLRIVLASTSSARIAMLRAAGVSFTAASPGVDEDAITAPSPGELAMARAVAKAEALARPDTVVIAADQVAHIEGISFGKPVDRRDHRARLRQLRGRTHILTTAVCVILGDDGEHAWRRFAHSSVTFRADVSDDEIDAYVATGEGSYCAGGYAVEGLGGNLIAQIEGDYLNVLGLPLYEVLTVLRHLGWRPTFPAGAS